MKQFTYLLLISTWFYLFLSTNSRDLSFIIPNSVVGHIWHPTLFFAFPVKSKDLQPYLDPQLDIYEPSKNGIGYILFSMSNTVVPGQSGFADAEISTVVKYKNQLLKSGFHLHFGALGPAISGPLFALMPYGYSYTPNMYSTTNEAAYTYQFVINDNQVQLNTSITWNPNQTINVDTIQPNNLPSLLLNRTINSKFVQSVFKIGTPRSPKLPLFHGRQLDYDYDEPLHPCTINTFQSTFLQTTVGPIPLVQNSPIFCIFTLQRSANVTSTIQLDVNH